MLRLAAVLAVALLGGCYLGPYGDDGGEPGPGGTPPPPTGPWYYVCHRQVTCPGTTTQVVSGGTYCVDTRAEAVAREKESCQRNCTCSPVCSGGTSPCG